MNEPAPAPGNEPTAGRAHQADRMPTAEEAQAAERSAASTTSRGAP